MPHTVAQFLRSHWTSFLAAVAIGLLLALAGAFGTDGLSVPRRVLYWVPMLIAGTIGGFAVHRLTHDHLGQRPVALWAASTLLITIFGTLLVWAYSTYLFDSRPRSLVVLFLEVGAVSATASAIIILVTRPGARTSAAPAGSTPEVRFLARIPEKLKGGRLLAVEAEDHYLRIHTSRGSDLILMRLSDAIGELDGIEGAQTHRSWWVARDGVASARRSGGRTVLVLKDGAEAPVSRANVRPLHDIGWF